jgi:protein-tyrosine phosphatase
VQELQAAIDAQRLGLVIHPGGELHPDRARELTAAELGVLTHGPRGAEWVLLEAPFAGIDDAFLSTCRDLRERGVGLVLAHPERAAGLLEGGLVALQDELTAGAVLQVNVCSLLGNHGATVRETAVRLIRDGLAYLLASDAHPGSRDHTLRHGFELALDGGASSVHAWRLTQANPRFLLRHGIPRVTAAGAGVALSR